MSRTIDCFLTSLPILLISLVTSCDSARILNIITVSSRSHYILGHSLSEGLADAGHDVTFISAFSGEYTPTNISGKFNQIVLEGFLEEFNKQLLEMDLFEEDSQSISSLISFGFMGIQLSEMVLKSKEVQALIRSDEKFDVLLLEEFVDDSLKSLSTHFGAHIVMYSGVGTSWFVNHISGTPSLPSYHPETIFLALPDHMDFWQRLKNTVYTVILSSFTHLRYYPEHDKLVKKYINPNLSVYDVINNQSLVLVNTHISIAPAVPQVPQMVFIGGYHIKSPKKLPDDLQQYLDNSTNGVIYFSMGSVLRSTDMAPEKRDLILRTFKKFKQNVLWKWEDEVLPNQPPNVKTSKWLPQKDLLAHPNIKLFITHCGYGSLVESIYNGKPVVALPIFGDQPANAIKAEELGTGKRLNFKDLTEESFTEAIKEVLEDPKYAKNAKYRSEIYRDRRTTPLQDAVYWIEYVLRHNGARHLRVNYLNMLWYEYYLLDVAAFIFLIIFGCFIVLRTVWRRILFRFRREKVKKN